MDIKYKLEKGTATITGCDPKPTGALIIPDTIDGFPVTAIGDSAFQYCRRLTNATIPNSVTAIGEWAFRGCIKLTDVTIPNSVTSIGWRAFPKHTVITRETA